MEIQELIKQGNQLAKYTDFEKARAAFVSSFRRTSENGGKMIRAIVIQPISL